MIKTCYLKYHVLTSTTRMIYNIIVQNLANNNSIRNFSKMIIDNKHGVCYQFYIAYDRTNETYRK